MERRSSMCLRLALIAGSALCFACHGPSDGDTPASANEHAGAAAEEIRGPHGARLLSDERFAVEVSIYERGVPPEFRIYAYQDTKPVDPSSVALTIELRRFGGRVDTFHFKKREDYLLGDQTVEEPHSFDVTVVAEHEGRTHRWQYSSYEGRTNLSLKGMQSSGVRIETAGPAKIRTTVRGSGRVLPNEDHVAQVIPRYPGIVKELRKRLGDRVERGEVLAVVESNQGLQTYEIRAPFGGTVIRRDVAPGEFSGDGKVVYEIADLATVWVDLNFHPEDARRLRVGQTAKLEVAGGVVAGEGRIVFISPIAGEDTQMLVARAEVANPSGEWRPGLFASAEIAVEEAAVPVAVHATALQTFRDWTVVFLNDGTLFQAMPVEVGRRDAHSVEILAGVEAGQRYVAEGSFIVKADIGKSGAVHEH